MAKYYLPSSVKRKDIYHEDWIDFNKNGVMDPYENPNLPVEERIEDLLSKMTLEEKIIELRSGSSNVGNLSHVTRRLPPKECAVKGNEYEIQAIENTRLGIPAIIHDECLHGCMVNYSTSFPQAIALAATWDPDLVYRVAKAIARETRSRNIHQCLSPVVNIVRDVRAGRTEESYGEDPYLTSIMGKVFCKALREENVIATPKHFVANFVGDGGRDSNEIHFSERILREIYFPGFRECIRAGALSVMSAYNSLDGIPCSCNKWLLTEVLRWEWGFEGFVVSDYASVEGIISKHHVTDKMEVAAKLALESGLEVELPRTTIYGEPLVKAVREGLISMDVIDEAVRRVLRAKFLIGLFDKPFVDPEEAVRINGCEEHAFLALQASRSSIVLLKNEENILPIDVNRVKTMAVIGPLSDELKLGGYSGIPPRKISPLQGIKDIAGKYGIKVFHEKGCPESICWSSGLSPIFTGLEIQYFDNPDLSGEPVASGTSMWIRFDWGYGKPHPNISTDKFSIRLTGKLIPPGTGVYRLILTANGGGVRMWINDKLLVDSWNSKLTLPKKVDIKLKSDEEYNIRLEYHRISDFASLRLSWDIVDFSGIKKAVEIAEKSDIAIIFVGITEGEGRDRAILRLPRIQEKLIEEVLKVKKKTIVVLMTGSAVIGDWIYDVPGLIQAWYPGQEGGRAIAETLFGECDPGGRLPFTWPHCEGQLPLYYDYKPSGRAYDYIDMVATPLFPFGYGLSYTKFKYSNLKIKSNEDGWKISVDIENIGDRRGYEVVQLYIRDVVASMARPFKELRGFSKIMLEPGEKKTVTFTLTPDDLAMFDSRMRRIVEPGEFEILIGRSSEDILVKGKIVVDKLIKGRFKCSLDREVGEVKRGEQFKITAVIENIGQISDLIPIELLVDGKILERHRIDLAVREKRKIGFKLKFTEPGEHRITLRLPEESSSLAIYVR